MKEKKKKESCGWPPCRLISSSGICGRSNSSNSKILFPSTMLYTKEMFAYSFDIDFYFLICRFN